MRLNRTILWTAVGAIVAISAGATVVALITVSEPVSAYTHGWAHSGLHGGWFGMAMGPFMMILWIALVIAAVMLVLRLFGTGARKMTGEEMPPQFSAETALDILKRRFAGGEIDAKTFDSMKARLAKE